MKILRTKPLIKTQFLDLLATEYLNKKNQTNYWTWCSRPNGMKAVYIAAVVDKGWITMPVGAGYQRDLRLVVIKEFRVPLQDYEFSLPAGLIDKNESIEEAARREFFEEVGLNVTKIKHISPFIINSAGLSDESISIVFCEAEGEISNKNNESSEEIEIIIADKNKVQEILENPNNKISAKAWLIFNSFIGRNFFKIEGELYD